MGPAIVTASVSLLLALVVSVVSRREVPSGMALVVQGRGDRVAVHFGQCHVLPLLETAELLDSSTMPIVLKRRGRSSLRCRDSVRAVATVTFLVGVNATREDVARVRLRANAKTLASAAGREALLGPLFERALDVVAARFDYEDPASQQDVFCAKVHE